MTARGGRTGLRDLGDGCYAWVRPPGCWGYANSGLVVDSGQALVVDTQNDMPMASALHSAIQELPNRPLVDQVVNTHGDGDHWNGNLLFEDATIISSEATLQDIRSHWLDPSKIDAYSQGDTAFAEFMRWRLAVFDYTDWRPVHPTATYSDRLTLRVGDRDARLEQLGPAHTSGDTIVWIPAAGVVYSGDLLFTASTPIMWAGPIARCIAACDRILELEPRVVVPGHGPLIGPDGVRPVRDYLVHVRDHASREYKAGKPPIEAYRTIDLSAYADWPHLSRTYQNIRLIYREPEEVDVRDTLEVVYSEDRGDWRALAP